MWGHSYVCQATNAIKFYRTNVLYSIIRAFINLTPFPYFTGSRLRARYESVTARTRFWLPKFSGALSRRAWDARHAQPIREVRMLGMHSLSMRTSCLANVNMDTISPGEQLPLAKKYAFCELIRIL